MYVGLCMYAYRTYRQSLLLQYSYRDMISSLLYIDEIIRLAFCNLQSVADYPWRTQYTHLRQAFKDS